MTAKIGDDGDDDHIDGYYEEEGGSIAQHQEMYAGVSNLFAACETINATRPNRRRTVEEKREERLSANRRSARDSRNRKKLVFEELQRSVARLAEENDVLRKENESIRDQMNYLMRQFGLIDGDAGRAESGNTTSQGALQPQQQVLGINLMQQKVSFTVCICLLWLNHPMERKLIS